MLPTGHTDITGSVNPPFLSVLRPAPGGIPSHSDDPAIAANNETSWVNLAAAYEALSPAQKERIEGLRAYHEHYDLGSVHPLVAVAPETQERLLIVSPLTLRMIEWLSHEERDTLCRVFDTFFVCTKLFIFNKSWLTHGFAKCTPLVLQCYDTNIP